MDGVPEEYMIGSEVDDEEDEEEKNQLPILTIEDARDLIFSVLNQEMDHRFDSVLNAVEETVSRTNLLTA
jgi:hypothetical protein